MQYFSSSIRNLSLWSSLNSSSMFLGSLLIMKGLVHCLWSHNRVLEDSALGMLRLSRSHSHRCSPLMLLRPTESSSRQRSSLARGAAPTPLLQGHCHCWSGVFLFLYFTFSLFALQTDRVLALDSSLLAYPFDTPIPLSDQGQQIPFSSVVQNVKQERETE